MSQAEIREAHAIGLLLDLIQRKLSEAAPLRRAA
jgi:hypothetical protein